MDVEMPLLEASFPDKAMFAEIMDENEPNPLAVVKPDALRAALPEILRFIDEIPAPEKLIDMLTQAGAVKSLADIGLPASMQAPTAHLSPYVRARLTFMRLLKMFTFERDIFSA